MNNLFRDNLIFNRKKSKKNRSLNMVQNLKHRSLLSILEYKAERNLIINSILKAVVRVKIVRMMRAKRVNKSKRLEELREEKRLLSLIQIWKLMKRKVKRIVVFQKENGMKNASNVKKVDKSYVVKDAQMWLTIYV